MYITKTEANILKYFLRLEEYCFTTKDVYKAFPDDKKIYLSQLLSGMVKKGSIIRLGHGLYYIVPLGEDAEYFIPNWHIVSKYLMKNRNYYIGYYSALQIHDLITQPSLKEFIVTDVQIRNNQINIKNVNFHFVYQNPKKFFGFKDFWLNDHEKVKCSDLEKTIVDCLVSSNYGGGILEISKAIYKAKDKINYKKLLDYFNRVGSKAAMKRFGIISEILKIDVPILEEIIRQKGNSVSLFDITQPDEGKINSHWGLKINYDLKTLEQAIYT